MFAPDDSAVPSIGQRGKPEKYPITLPAIGIPLHTGLSAGTASEPTVTQSVLVRSRSRREGSGAWSHSILPRDAGERVFRAAWATALKWRELAMRSECGTPRILRAPELLLVPWCSMSSSLRQSKASSIARANRSPAPCEHDGCPDCAGRSCTGGATARRGPGDWSTTAVRQGQGVTPTAPVRSAQVRVAGRASSPSR